MLDPKQLEKMADAITDPFLEGAHLDTRGIPNWRNLPPEESFIDPRFGGLVHEYRQDLRKELAALADDPTVLAELAKRDPAAAQELETRREEEIAEEFVRQQPAYYACQENSDALYAYLEASDLPMTPENLARAYGELLAAGKLKVSPNEPRIVPLAERIRLARMAANGDAQNALVGYLHQCLPKAVVDKIDGADGMAAVEELLNGPENQPLLREATIEVWFWSNPKVPPTPELRDWFAKFTKEMLAFNLDTLSHAYFNYLGHKEDQREAGKAQAAGAPVNQDVPTPAGLEELSDAEVAELMRGVTRERARGMV